MSYSTASHGGFVLSVCRNRELFNKAPCFHNEDRHYEEDCEYAKVVLVFQQHFDAKAIERAHRSAKTWYPNLYEAWRRMLGEDGTGRNPEPDYEIPLAESFKKREAKFRSEHLNDMLVIAASTSSMHPGMVECTAVKGGRDERGHYERSSERIFLVPKAEYDTRGEFSFVIKVGEHAELVSRKVVSEPSRNHNAPGGEALELVERNT
jgi:hypothetical protein